MKEKNINIKINYSLELLILILAFWVVMEHSYKYINKFSKARFHIPAFMIISFYFYYNTLKSKSIIKIYLRFQRILIPYIIWPTFIFINNNILFTLFGYSQFNRILLLKYLLYQLIFGSVYHFIFYYQFNLILFTILFTIIIFIFRKSFIFIFQILLILGYILQYSYWNFYFFKKYKSSVNISLGHISEFIPFAITGIIFGYLDIITKTKKLAGLPIFYCISIIILTLKFEIFVRIIGFWYPGILLNIGGICIFILFSLLSFQNNKIIFFFKIITKFTGGIYCVHLICISFVRNFLGKLLFIQKGTIYFSITIYIISYIICYFGNKLCGKTKLKFLFN